ncbi:Type 1 glutamine amidotransferase-like domain-containing protein, partial [Treponema pedis]|uniref:Type 1 glutamine amidotransferase-like domain-containing protein n=1 Tax=Treponema pedis TaxID=409322 RepID=UPI00049432D5
ANPEKVTFYVGADKKALEKIGLIIDELDISNSNEETINKKLKQNDYIFVSGGNTFYLLQELKRTGADKILIEQIKSGKPYIGSSAGSIILSKDIRYVSKMDSPKKAPNLNDYKSLGIVDFYPLPHYGNAPFKKIGEGIVSEYGSQIDLKPINNKQAILVKSNKSEIREET